MQARGVVTVAQQDFYAKLAENTSWLTVAGNAADILGSFGDALSKLITSLTSNTGFMNSVNAVTSLFEYVS